MIVIDKYGSEIQAMMMQFGNQCEGKQPKEILQLQRECNKALTELLARHKRELDFLAGEKIEPQVHYAEAVLVGTGAQGSP